ncbi:hypothetical protein CKF54_00085 [Psittacicella hinzii]|uniref:Uncharacterized protein n=1 Tax=Psittacicella hinzii TaxID=2028575 RepID=A0A3A1YBJ6_9GAMM|nr:hypothetical protein [Psittacicella hinzii]RIY34558.1 hypothetical protein CKF54_00085 [Psittacicella hinzii]
MQKHLFLLTSATCASLVALIQQRKEINPANIYVLYNEQAANSLLNLDIPAQQMIAIDDYIAQFTQLRNQFSLDQYFARVQNYYQLIANLLSQGQQTQVSAQSLTLDGFHVYVPCLDTIEAQTLANHPQCESLTFIESDVYAYFPENLKENPAVLQEFTEFYQDYPEANYYATGIPPFTVCKANDLVGLMNPRLGLDSNPITFFRTNQAAYYWLNGHSYQGRRVALYTLTREELTSLPQAREFTQLYLDNLVNLRRARVNYYIQLKPNLWVIDKLTLELLTPENFADYLIRMAEKFSSHKCKKLLVKLTSAASETQRKQITLALNEYKIEAIFLDEAEFLLPSLLSLPANAISIHSLIAPELIYALIAKQNYISDLFIASNYPEVSAYLDHYQYNFTNLLASLQKQQANFYKETDAAKKIVQYNKEQMLNSHWHGLVEQALADYDDLIYQQVQKLVQTDRAIVVPNYFDPLVQTTIIEESFAEKEQHNREQFAPSKVEERRALAAKAQQAAKQISALDAEDTILGNAQETTAQTATAQTATAQTADANQVANASKQASGTNDKAETTSNSNQASNVQLDSENLNHDRTFIGQNHDEEPEEVVVDKAQLLKMLKEKALEGSPSDLKIQAQARSLIGNTKAIRFINPHAKSNDVNRESNLSVAYQLAEQRLDKESQAAAREIRNPFAQGVNDYTKKVEFSLDLLQKFIARKMPSDLLSPLGKTTLGERKAQAQQAQGFTCLSKDKFTALPPYAVLELYYSSLEARKHSTGKIVVIDNEQMLKDFTVWKRFSGFAINEMVILTTQPQLVDRVSYAANRVIDISPYFEELEAKPYFNIQDLINVGYKLQNRIQILLGFSPAELYVPQFNKSLYFALLANLPLVKVNVLQEKGVSLEYPELGLSALHKLLDQFQANYPCLVPKPLLVQEKHGIDDILYRADNETERNKYLSYKIRGKIYNITE